MSSSVVLASIPSPDQGVWYVGPVPIRAYALAIILGVVPPDHALVTALPKWLFLVHVFWFTAGMIVGFEHQSDAEKFLADLVERLAKFELSLHPGFQSTLGPQPIQVLHFALKPLPDRGPLGHQFSESQIFRRGRRHVSSLPTAP